MNEYLIIEGLHICASLADAQIRGLRGAAECTRDTWFPPELRARMVAERIGIVPHGFKVFICTDEQRAALNARDVLPWGVQTDERTIREATHTLEARALAVAFPEHKTHHMIDRGPKVAGGPHRLHCQCGAVLKWKRLKD